ncbi:MAG: hypothetical protein PWQ55_1956 [Chloroflexota bacterium]|nr:hypothetical protein [Chloroflexota bacterium]
MKKQLTLAASSLQGKNGRMIVAVLTIALFVISAGAPSCAIGIGK